MMYTEMLPAGGGTMESVNYPSAAAVTYTGAGGEEEMHVFFHLAWFDLGSWAWAHYITEWATKGIFQVIKKTLRLGEAKSDEIDRDQSGAA